MLPLLQQDRTFRMRENNLGKYKAQIADLGLDFESIENHHQKLFTEDNSENLFLKIEDTCRLDNGGVIKIPAEPLSPPSESPQIVAFVPAAGAASRYFKTLGPLQLALEQGEWQDALTAIRQLREEGAESWPLPESLRQVLTNTSLDQESLESQTTALLTAISRPKALQPCVVDGATFLQLKLSEHDLLDDCLLGQTYIFPPGYSDEFNDYYRSQRHQIPIHLLEQGPRLSTLRFHTDGSLVVDDNGEPSLVPAGHGALARLFPEVKAAFPAAKGIFIRNVDNVSGSNHKAIVATKNLIALFNTCEQSLTLIRQGMSHRDEDSIEKGVKTLEQLLPKEDSKSRELTDRLRRLQMLLFHNPSHTNNWDLLRQHYDRPLNLLGQVPNTRNDIGGTPCFVESPSGIVKICLEVPHASPEDKDSFLANPDKATHFNPVFAVCELIEDRRYYHPPGNPFWLKARKTYKGMDVVYYETVLYELIGNSTMANTLFVEVPRAVFNPHKVMADGASNNLATWLN